MHGQRICFIGRMSAFEHKNRVWSALTWNQQSLQRYCKSLFASYGSFKQTGLICVAGILQSAHHCTLPAMHLHNGSSSEKSLPACHTIISTISSLQWRQLIHLSMTGAATAAAGALGGNQTFAMPFSQLPTTHEGSQGSQKHVFPWAGLKKHLRCSEKQQKNKASLNQCAYTVHFRRVEWRGALVDLTQKRELQQCHDLFWALLARPSLSGRSLHSFTSKCTLTASLSLFHFMSAVLGLACTVRMHECSQSNQKYIPKAPACAAFGFSTHHLGLKQLCSVNSQGANVQYHACIDPIRAFHSSAVMLEWFSNIFISKGGVFCGEKWEHPPPDRLSENSASLDHLTHAHAATKPSSEVVLLWLRFGSPPQGSQKTAK